MRADRLEKVVMAMFGGAAAGEVGLGLYRAHLLQESPLPALLAVVALAGTALLWVGRRRSIVPEIAGRIAGILTGTLGLYSATSSLNAPFVSLTARLSLPVLLLGMSGLLLFATNDWRIQLAPIVLFIVGFVAFQTVLTHEARWRGGERIGRIGATGPIGPIGRIGQTGHQIPQVWIGALESAVL